MNKIQLNKLLDKQAKEIEKRINIIQRSTKTFLPGFSKSHNILRTKFNWYEAWHLNPWVTRVHVAVLAIYTIFMFAFAGSVILNQPGKIQAAGVTYYVATTGNDLNNGTTERNPFLTIQKAANVAQAGDTVLVRGGDYGNDGIAHTHDYHGTLLTSYRIEPANSGNAQAPITYQAAPGETVKMTSGWYITKDYIHLKGFEIEGFGNLMGRWPPEIHSAVTIEGSNNVIEDFYVHHLRGGFGGFLFHDSSSNNIVKNSKLYRFGNGDNQGGWWHGVVLGGTNNTFQDGHIEVDYKDYLSARAAAEFSGVGNKFIGNTVIGPYRGSGVGCWSFVKDLTIKNNKIYNIRRRMPGYQDTGDHIALMSFYSGAENVTIEGNVLGSRNDQYGDADGNPVGTTPPAEPYFEPPDASQSNIWFGGIGSVNKNFTVRNNVILKATGGGYVIEQRSTTSLDGWYFYNNILYSNTSITLLGTLSNSYSKNNIVLGGSLGQGSKDYNLYLGSVPSGESYSTSVASINDIKFVNPDVTSATKYGVNADWHLQTGSPAINVGISDANTPTTDKDGNARVGAPDIGAYEYQTPANALYVATTGNDTTGDGTETKPYKTIQKAADMATAGKTIYVKEGTYNERVTISTNATQNNPLIFTKLGSIKPVVTNGFILRGSYIKVQGFEIANCQALGDRQHRIFWFDSTANNSEASDIYMHDCPPGGGTEGGFGFNNGASSNKVLNSHQVGGSAPHFNPYDRAEIAQNNLVDNLMLENYSWTAYLGGKNNTVQNSTIHNNANGSDLYYPSGDGQTFRNNKVYGLHRPDYPAPGWDEHTDMFQAFSTNVTNFTVENNVLGSWERTGTNQSRDPDNTFFMLQTNGPPITGPVIIRNNVILGGANYWIDINDVFPEVPIDNFKIYNNVIYTDGNLRSSVKYHNWEVRNNIYIGKGYGPGENNNVSDYNMFWGAVKPPEDGSHSFVSTALLTDIFENPDITSTAHYGVDANWHLKNGSPAIDVGISDANTPATDKDGNPRVGAPDIGAYEYGGGAPPPADTLSVSLSANPSSGNAPLSGVALSADVSGTATGTINYTFYCNRSDTGTNITTPNSHKLDATTNDPYSAPSDTCNSIYQTPGTYTAKVIVERGTLAVEARTTITVTSPTPSGTNVALASNGGTIVSQSHQEPNGPATGLIDGVKVFNQNNTTWMVQNPTGTENVVIRFSSPSSINRIEHFNDGQYGARSVAVGRSDNGSSWTPLVSKNDLKTTPATTPNQDTITFDPVQTQYLKFEYSSFINSSWLQLNEIEVYTTEGASDTTPPTASVTSPSSGANVSGNVNIQATASDNIGVSKVEFYVDGTKEGEDATSPYSYTWNSPTASYGNHTIYVRACDAASNCTNSSSISVSIGLSLSYSTVTANPTTVTVPGSSTITITLKDTNNNPVPGHSITLSSTYQSAGDVITQPLSSTNSSGVTTGTVSSALAHSSTITAYDNTASQAIGQTQLIFQLASSTNQGFVLNGWGGIWPFGGASSVSNQTHWIGWDIARDFVLRSNGTSGYVLDGWGGIHPFGDAPSVSITGYWPGWDIARAIVLRDDNSGYVLNGWGGVWPFGGAPALSNQTHWTGWDIARDIVLRSDKQGGYVLNKFGGIHRFGNAPNITSSSPVWWSGIARAIVLRDDNSGYVLNGWGGIHPFGGAPALSNQTHWLNWDIARDLDLRSDKTSGYVVNGWGGVHPFGGAPRIPNQTNWLNWDIARKIRLVRQVYYS